MPPKKKQNNKKKTPPPKVLNVPKVEWAEQTPEQRAETIQEIKSKFSPLQLKGVEIVEAKETQYPPSEGLSMEHLTAVGACTEAQGKELSKFSNLMDVFDKFEVGISSVCVGCKMPFLVSGYDLDNKEQPILEDRRGKVVFIQFWTPWNVRCQKAVAKVMAVVNKRAAEWKNKVAFLTVACDTTLEKLKAELTAKNWLNVEGVEHLWSGGEGGEDEEDKDGDGVVTKYEIEDLPECMIIDPEGKLLKRGDIEDFNLEDHLEKILAGVVDYEGEAKVPEAGTWQALTPEARQAVVTRVVDVLKSDPNLGELTLALTEAKIHPVMGTITHEEINIMLMGKVDVRSERRVPEISKLVKDSNVSDLEQIVMVTAPAGPVQPSETCYICKNKFTQGTDVRWHCAMCVTPVTMCTPCINKDQKGPKEERSDHPNYHPWFRIGPQTTNEDLEALEFGMGSFACALIDEAEEEKKAQQTPQEGDKSAGTGVVHDDVYCNGCKTGPISDMPRWKCCSCADFDLCDDCFTKHVQNTPAPKKAAPKKKGAKGKEKEKEPTAHDQRHVFLRIDDSDAVRPAEDDEDEGDFGDYDEGDLDLFAEALGDEDEGEGFDGTAAIVQKIRELSATGGLDEDDEEAPKTKKGKPKIREVAGSDEESEEEAGKPARDGSDEDSEAEEEPEKKAPKGKAAKKPNKSTKDTKKALDGSDEDSEAEDEQLNQLAEEAAQVPLPDDDEDFQ